MIVLLLVVWSAQLGDPEKIMKNSNNKIQHRSNKAENRLTLKPTRHADTVSSDGKRRKEKKEAKDRSLLRLMPALYGFDKSE